MHMVQLSALAKFNQHFSIFVNLLGSLSTLSVIKQENKGKQISFKSL